MCPGVAVEGPGDASGAGGGAGGKGGAGGGGAGGNQGGDAANGGQQGAPDPEKFPDCGTASHPVDVVTGRAFTHPIEDFRLGGPMPFTFTRSASSTACRRDFGLGWGWGHSLGWEIEIRRTVTRVWCDKGVAVDFPRLNPGDIRVGPWGWLVRREAWGYAVDSGDGLWRIFSTEPKKGRRYRLTAVEDRNKNRIVLVYDDGGWVLREVHDSAGRIIRVRSDAHGRIEQFQIQNAASQGQWVALATYEHDASGCLTKATDADGFVAEYAHDSDHRLTKDQDRTGLTFHFRFVPRIFFRRRHRRTRQTRLRRQCRGVEHLRLLARDAPRSVAADGAVCRTMTLRTNLSVLCALELGADEDGASPSRARKIGIAKTRIC